MRRVVDIVDTGWDDPWLEDIMILRVKCIVTLSHTDTLTRPVRTVSISSKLDWSDEVHFLV